MRRVEFRLTMPGCPSWNGRWSGEGKNYAITRRLTERRAAELFSGKDHASWTHAWRDGWCAVVEGRIMPPGERLKKSDGFSGYDWMVDRIIDHGSTAEPPQSADRVPSTDGGGLDQ